MGSPHNFSAGEGPGESGTRHCTTHRRRDRRIRQVLAAPSLGEDVSLKGQSEMKEAVGAVVGAELELAALVEASVEPLVVVLAVVAGHERFAATATWILTAGNLPAVFLPCHSPLPGLLRLPPLNGWPTCNFAMERPRRAWHAAVSCW